MQDYDGAMQCYQQALNFNKWSVPAMQGIACILRTKDAFPDAVEYLRTILKVDGNNGDVWGSLGKTFLAYSSTSTNSTRSLLSHDGRLATGLLRLSASAIPLI
jgi:tetratricopeptide (TPR) repeat protein